MVLCMGVKMSDDQRAVQRGRPLGYVSKKVLEKIGVERQATSAQLSTALQLNRRHATVICAKLAAAGYLEVSSRDGRLNVYSLREEKPQKQNEPTWFIFGEALRP